MRYQINKQGMIPERKENNMKWQKWLKGLISAIIGGAANSITVMIVEPTQFNLDEGLGKLGTVALVSAIVAAAMYLKQAPVPPD